MRKTLAAIVITTTAAAVAPAGTALAGSEDAPRGPCNRGTMNAHDTVPHETEGNHQAHQSIPHCEA
ncbi:MAG: hypothetical protein ACRD0N_13665 [Acidimicrobiales bacterium]